MEGNAMDCYECKKEKDCNYKEEYSKLWNITSADREEPFWMTLNCRNCVKGAIEINTCDNENSR